MALSFVEQLMRSRQGDTSALDELLKRWRPLLQLQARQLLGAAVSARVDPSDVVQETLTQAFQSIDQFQGATEGEWVAWLRRMVAGHAAKVRRHHSADRRDAQRDQPWPEEGVGGSGPDPASEIASLEQAAALARAVEALPPDRRDVVVRRILDRQPIATVARELGRTPGAVRVLLTRALRQLRDLIDR
jgi:RNA polymerase sigma-70 factor (ECF subfamily)